MLEDYYEVYREIIIVMNGRKSRKKELVKERRGKKRVTERRKKGRKIKGKEV